MNEMTQITAHPQQTYALIVGIAKYKCERINVKSGVTVQDAINFADYLLQQQVPPQNIKLCLSPLDGQMLNIPSELEVKSADRDTITSIINNFKEQNGDLLFMYWAGHGLITSELERRLLCADVTTLEDPTENIDFTSLLFSLKSSLYKIRHQIYLIDACANDVLREQEIRSLGTLKFSSKTDDWKPNKQFIMMIREGEKVTAGYFGEALLTVLNEQSPNTFPPNMIEIAQGVKHHLNNRIEREKKRPLNFIYHSIDWDGNVNINGQQHSGPSFPLKFHQFTELENHRRMKTSITISNNGRIDGITQIWTADKLQGFKGEVKVYIKDSGGNIVHVTDSKIFGVDGTFILGLASNRKETWDYAVPYKILGQIADCEIIHTAH